MRWRGVRVSDVGYVLAGGRKCECQVWIQVRRCVQVCSYDVVFFRLISGLKTCVRPRFRVELDMFLHAWNIYV